MEISVHDRLSREDWQNKIFREYARKWREKSEVQRAQLTSIRGIGSNRLSARVKSGFMKRGMAAEIVNACIRWNLFSGTNQSGLFQPTDTFISIGKSFQQKKDADARVVLFDSIVRARTDLLFHPSKIFIRTRNRNTDHVNLVIEKIPCELKRKQCLSCQKKNACLDMVTVKVPKLQGVGYDDALFLGFDLESGAYSFTNPVSMDVMFDWGDFFGFFNDFPLKLKIQLPKMHYKIRPKHGFYLTRIVCSVGEIMHMGELLQRSNSEEDGSEIEGISKSLNMTARAASELLYAGVKLGILSTANKKYKVEVKEVNLHFLLEKCRLTGDFLVSEDEKHPGILKEVVNVESSRVFLFVKVIWPTADFLNVLRNTHAALVRADPIMYSSIPTIRMEVCKKLRMTNNEFDENLRKCLTTYPTRIKLGLGSAELRKQLTGGWEKSFIYKGTPYYLLKVE